MSKVYAFQGAVKLNAMEYDLEREATDISSTGVQRDNWFVLIKICISSQERKDAQTAELYPYILAFFDEVSRYFWTIEEVMWLKTEILLVHFSAISGFPGSSTGKEPACNTGDTVDVGSIPGLGRSPGEGNDNPLQYSCLGNLMDRGAWQAAFHGVEKSWT